MPIRYEDRTLSELKQIGRARKIAGAHSMTKTQLIGKLRGGRAIKYQLKSPRQNKDRRARFEHCIQQLKARGDIRYNPFAVCEASIYR